MSRSLGVIEVLLGYIAAFKVTFHKGYTPHIQTFQVDWLHVVTNDDFRAGATNINDKTITLIRRRVSDT